MKEGRLCIIEPQATFFDYIWEYSVLHFKTWCLINEYWRRFQQPFWACSWYKYVYPPHDFPLSQESA